MISSRCCSHTVNVTQNILSVNSNISRIITGLANRLYYSKDKSNKGCENIPQTAGRQVEPWPKSDPPPPAWRCECPQEPQPPNYDPYKLKIPDIVVPPLPPSNVKWSGTVFMTSEEEERMREQQQFQQQQNYQNQFGHQEDCQDDGSEKQGIMGLLKGFFGKLTGKKKGDNESMMDIQNEDAGQPFKNVETNFSSDPQSHTWTRLQDLFQKSPFVHPDYWKDIPMKTVSETVKEVLPKLGYHGQNKYKYAFHEPWKPLDRLALLQQAEKEELGQLEPAGDAKQT